MDGISGAASIIAVVDISAKIASLCFQYSVAVENAKEDIKRLQGVVNDIKGVLGEHRINRFPGRRSKRCQLSVVSMERGHYIYLPLPGMWQR